MGRPRTRLKCPTCQKLKPPNECYLRPDGSILKCKKCQSEYAKQKYAERKEEKLTPKPLGTRKILKVKIQ